MTPVVELAGVSKDYRALRPLRLEQLTVGEGESVAILGLDAAAAEVLVNLVTGAVLPEAGEIRLFGRSTAAIADAGEWLAAIDRLGIVSARAVLLEQLSIVQNLAMPFTLAIEPPPDDVRQRAEGLGAEVGLPSELFAQPVAASGEAGKTRVRLGRALALDPRVLLMEHATAALDRSAAAAFGRDARRIAERRGVAIVAATADEGFATAVAHRVLVHDPASGRLAPRRRGWLRRP